MATIVSSHVPLITMGMSVLVSVPVLMGTAPQWMEHVIVTQVILDQLAIQVCVLTNMELSTVVNLYTTMFHIH